MKDLRSRDAGTVSAFVVVMTLALVALAGLVHDGSRLVAAQVAASDRAGAAARVGAQHLQGLRADALEIAPEAARRAAWDHLASSGTSGEIRADVGSVRVTVSVDVAFGLLRLIGLTGRQVSATRIAEVQRG